MVGRIWLGATRELDRQPIGLILSIDVTLGQRMGGSKIAKN